MKKQYRVSVQYFRLQSSLKTAGLSSFCVKQIPGSRSRLDPLTRTIWGYDLFSDQSQCLLHLFMKFGAKASGYDEWASLFMYIVLRLLAECLLLAFSFHHHGYNYDTGEALSI